MNACRGSRLLRDWHPTVAHPGRFFGTSDALHSDELAPTTAATRSFDALRCAVCPMARPALYFLHSLRCDQSPTHQPSRCGQRLDSSVCLQHPRPSHVLLNNDARVCLRLLLPDAAVRCAVRCSDAVTCEPISHSASLCGQTTAPPAACRYESIAFVATHQHCSRPRVLVFVCLAAADSLRVLSYLRDMCLHLLPIALRRPTSRPVCGLSMAAHRICTSAIFAALATQPSPRISSSPTSCVMPD